MKILYTVITYKRPQLLEQCLLSLQQERLLVGKDRIEIAVVDDCELEALPETGAQNSPLIEGFGCRLIQPADPLAKKDNHTKSRVGWGLNKAVRESDADLVMMICDDDMIYFDATRQIFKFFTECDGEQWGFGRAVPYDVANTRWGAIKLMDGKEFIQGEIVDGDPNRPRINRTPAANRLDISQVVWQREAQVKHNIWWTEESHPRNQPIDHMVYHQMDNCFAWECPNMDFPVQFKGVHPGQISRGM